MSVLSIYLTNLGAYNRGSLVGEWVDLPMDSEELKAKLKEILEAGEEGDEEYFITDYESELGIRVEEYSNLDNLNELAERLEKACSEHDENIVKAMLEEYSDIEEALDKLESGDYSVFFDIEDESDLGYAVVEEGLLGDIPDNLRNYLDYEAIGRDMTFDGWHIYENLKLAICFY